MTGKVGLLVSYMFVFPPFRAIPHPRGHAHLAALVNHDCEQFLRFRFSVEKFSREVNFVCVCFICFSANAG